MSLICGLGSCKEKAGMCLHEKLMAGLLGVIILIVIVVKLL